jgi:hypothetical protein
VIAWPARFHVRALALVPERANRRASISLSERRSIRCPVANCRLVPGATELSYALDLGDELIAVTHESSRRR